MDQHQHDGQSSRDETGKAPSRRKFLRQVGMTAAAAAAVAGAADVFGVAPAFAAAKQGTRDRSATPARKLGEAPPALAKKVREIRTARANYNPFYCCSPTPGDCGKPCVRGEWCHTCVSSTGNDFWQICLQGDSGFCVSY
jgi:hypothetical protein